MDRTDRVLSILDSMLSLLNKVIEDTRTETRTEAKEVKVQELPANPSPPATEEPYPAPKPVISRKPKEFKSKLDELLHHNTTAKIDLEKAIGASRGCLSNWAKRTHPCKSEKKRNMLAYLLNVSYSDIWDSGGWAKPSKSEKKADNELRSMDRQGLANFVLTGKVPAQVEKLKPRVINPSSPAHIPRPVDLPGGKTTTLSKARAALNLSQSYIDTILGYKRKGTVSKIERRELAPSPEVQEYLAKLLGFDDVSKLFDKDGYAVLYTPKSTETTENALL